MNKHSLKRKSTLAGLAAIILVASLSLGASGTTHAQGLTAARADIDDDGFVGFSDIIAVFMRFGQRNGDTGFREGLDLAPNGRIDYGDIVALFPFYYRSGVPTTPTTVSGVVYDGFGAALPNVIVSVGPSGTPSAPTANNGSYTIDAAGMGGDTEINFNGSAAIDPSPGVLSGQFPSIPHKPIFVNGGTNNVFRAMSLPERDLNGSVGINGGNATNNGGNSYTLNQEVSYKNPAAAGAAMTIPGGATVNFPPGESPQLSVMNVDPAFSPAPLPPGAGSTNVFVSFQPGGTEIDPSPGETLVVCFDNIDLFQNVYTGGALDTAHPNQPMLLGVEGGVFQKVATVIVTDASGVPSAEGVAGPKLRADIDLVDGFTFAWYPVIQTPPCPPTTVTGVVKDFATNPAGDPVGGATVSVPGYSPVTTNAAGFFSIPGVVAGPNGPRCFTNPFSLRASAVVDFGGSTEQGSSDFVAAVPGGTTDVGCIPLRGLGTVQGKLRKLVCLDPFTVVTLAGLEITLTPSGGTPLTTTTNAGGCYSFMNVAAGGAYTVSITDPAFDFDACPGTTSFNGFLGGVGEVDIVDFRLVGTGKSKVTVVDGSGTPQPFVFIDYFSFFREDLGGGFESPSRNDFAETDINGCATLLNIPLGGYRVSSGGFGESVPPPPGFGGGLFLSLENVIVCEGDCNEDLLAPPTFDECDLTDLLMEDVLLDPGDGSPLVSAVKLTLSFVEPLVAGPGQDVQFLDIQIHLDTDADTTTGRTRFVGGEIIDGIERTLFCGFEPGGFSDCDASEYGPTGNFIGGLDSPNMSIQQDPADPRNICIFLPNDPSIPPPPPGFGSTLTNDIIGSPSARFYLAVTCFTQNEQSAVDLYPADFVPPPAPIDFTSLPFSDTDPVGDVLLDFQFPQ